MTTRINNSRSAGNWVLFAFSIWGALGGWLLGLLSMLTWFAHKPRFEGAGYMTLKLRDWFSLRPTPEEPDDEGHSRYSTTFLRAIWYHERRPLPTNMHEEVDTSHEVHERDHGNQFEELQFAGFWAGLLFAAMMWIFGWYAEAWQPAVLWLLMWVLSPAMMIPNFVVSLLRYGLAAKVKPNGKERSTWERIYDTMYLDSAHEQRARAVSQSLPNGQTWIDREYERRH